MDYFGQKIDCLLILVTDRSFMGAGEALVLLRPKDELIPQPDWRLGFGLAKYYQLRHAGARVGFIGAMTNLHYCERCNNCRTASSVGGRRRVSRRSNSPWSPRQGRISPSAVRRILLPAALQRKPLEHRFRNNYTPCRPMTAIGG